jgi:RND superfamily putative drug exporter
VLRRWARFAVRHRWAVLAAWAVAIATLAAFSVAFGGRFVDSFEIPGSESQDAVELLEDHFPDQAGDSATLAFKNNEGVRDPEVRDRMEDVVSRARDLPEVTEVASPYVVPGAISEDRKIAYATVQYGKPGPEVSQKSVDKLLDLADEADGGGLRVEAGGQVVSSSEVSPPGESEIIGIAAAVVILLVAFGSVVAMGLPIVTALVGLGSGFLLISLAASVMDMTTFTPAFASMVGLGVGIDYALFVVTRFREGLSAGFGVEKAVVGAVDTAGRAVVSAGVVVVIALLGLLTIGIPFVSALGVAAAMVVALAVLVAVSLLPALLGLIGDRVDRWRIPGLRTTGVAATGDERTRTASYRFSRLIQRHPWPYAIGAALLLLALAAPVLDMRLGFSDDGNKPTSFDSRRAYDLLAEGFGPGFNGPLVVAVEQDGGLARATLARLSKRLDEADNVDSVTPPQPNKAGNAAVLTVYPTTSPQSAATEDLVDRMRDDVVPDALDGTDAVAYVGGATASFVDIGERIAGRMPLFFAFVVGLSFLLLMAVFRSVVVPVKAAIMNLLSVGAAYGVLVPIFQWGWGEGLLDIRPGPVEAFLPMMLFAILFGLSMDYEVFLVSRIRESYLRSGDPRGSVADGLAITARVITAAAAIMVCVFLSFVLGDDRIIKEFGLGLAAAIFVDATVIRLVLVPSTMTLLGRWNWGFPRWLDAIVPKLNIEGGPSAPLPAEDNAAASRLLLAGLSMEYLARRLEEADGDYPNLTRAAAALVPETSKNGNSTHQDARLATRNILRPLALRATLAGVRAAGSTAPSVGTNGSGEGGPGCRRSGNDGGSLQGVPPGARGKGRSALPPTLFVGRHARYLSRDAETDGLTDGEEDAPVSG